LPEHAANFKTEVIMKQINIANGEIRIGWEFNDLSIKAQDKVINHQINFEIELMDENSPYFDCVEKMDRNLTPWFLGECIFTEHKEGILNSCRDYLYDESGEMIPITHIIKNDKIIKTIYRIAGKEYDCKIIRVNDFIE
jgi:hypothetical protein